MTFTIYMSVISCMLSSSWVMIWIMLELNTMSFCSLMLLKMNNTKNSEMSMKYFIIQSMTSAFLLFSMMFIKTNKIIMLIMMMMSNLALLIKMAASPFQEWFVKITKNMKMLMATLLMTWQKLAPTFLIMYQLKIMVYPFIFISMVLGTLLQMNKTNFLVILSYSSLFNLSWMIMLIFLSSSLFFTYLMIYWSTVLMLMMLLKKTKQKNINNLETMKKNKLLLMVLIANLAGIPPLPGFIAKWISMKESLTHNLLMITLLILTISAINFYIYLRMFISPITKTFNISQNILVKTNLFINLMMFMTLILQMTLFIM